MSTQYKEVRATCPCFIGDYYTFYSLQILLSSNNRKPYSFDGLAKYLRETLGNTFCIMLRNHRPHLPRHPHIS